MIGPLGRKERQSQWKQIMVMGMTSRQRASGGVTMMVQRMVKKSHLYLFLRTAVAKTIEEKGWLPPNRQ